MNKTLVQSLNKKYGCGLVDMTDMQFAEYLDKKGLPSLLRLLKLDSKK